VIPVQLKTWRFILLCARAKIPTAEMKGWANNRETITLAYDDSRLLEHIKDGKNYGVVTGEDRFVVAADTKEIERALEERLPKTFTVQSPRHKTKHFYFYGKLTRAILCKPGAQGDPCADVKTGNSYVVGPGSVFESYGEYKLVDDIPIATISEEQLFAAIDEFVVPKKDPFVSDVEGDHDANLEFPILDIIPNIDALTRNGNELFGPHPLHGSTTGSNFHVNLEKNVWHCFRAGHDSGGGPLELLAVLNKIIKCEDCHKGALRAQKFKETVTLAKEKGLITIAPLEHDRGQESDEKNERMREILHSLQSQFTFKTPDDIEEIYYFKDGVYEKAETMIKGLAEKWLGEEGSSHFIEEILGHIRRNSYVKRSEFNKPGLLIPVQNGLLNLKTLKLEPFDKNKIFTYKINAVYDESKKSLKFLKFIDEVLDPEDKPIIQEYSGYCLLNAMPYHRMLWLVGVGRNGKTSYVNTLTALFGPENCSELGIEELDGNHRFSMSLLYGKMINVSSEPSVTKMLQTPLLKKATGDDWIDAEVKNKQNRIKFKNTAKFFVLGNRYPRVNDNTLAFWARIIIVRFPNTYIGTSVIPQIETTWTKDPEEMSGILNWALEGLHRLLMNNDFTVSKSSEETILEFQKASDTTLAFLNECCEHANDGLYIKADLYELYKEYCDASGLNCDQPGMFSAKLNSQPWIKSSRRRIEGKQEHVWIGLRVRALTESGEQQQLGTVPPVPSVPPFISSKNLSNREEIDRERLSQCEKGGTLGTGGTPTEEMICGKCALWHKPGCSFPESEPSCVNPNNRYAADCRDFILTEAQL
jgi:putative DNA primase/helicase